jgi:hypothetical protein
MGYYLNGYDCLACDTKCSTCSQTSTLCYSCKVGYALVNN